MANPHSLTAQDLQPFVDYSFQEPDGFYRYAVAASLTWSDQGGISTGSDNGVLTVTENFLFHHAPSVHMYGILSQNPGAVPFLLNIHSGDAVQVSIDHANNDSNHVSLLGENVNVAPPAPGQDPDSMVLSFSGDLFKYSLVLMKVRLFDWSTFDSKFHNIIIKLPVPPPPPTPHPGQPGRLRAVGRRAIG